MDIRSVTDANLHILLNLMQAYEAEFSPITLKDPASDGLYPLDTAIGENYKGFLWYVNGVPCGLAIKGIEAGRHDIAEFYVVPSRRGKGTGAAFVKRIFDMYRGDWQVRQIEGADLARRFWRKVIGEYTQQNYEEEQIDDPYWGPVTCQRFTNRGGTFEVHYTRAGNAE